MKIVVGKYIVIDKIEEAVKVGSFELSSADTSQISALKGKVYATGEDVIPGIKEGDEIYYQKARSYEMVLNGEIRTVIREQDVIVVL